MKTRFPGLAVLLLFLGSMTWAMAQENQPQEAKPQESASEPVQLKAEELKDMVDRKAEFFFLDVREPKELEDLGTLEGYVNIPMGQLEEKLADIPRGKPVIIA